MITKIAIVDVIDFDISLSLLIACALKDGFSGFRIAVCRPFVFGRYGSVVQLLFGLRCNWFGICKTYIFY